MGVVAVIAGNRREYVELLETHALTSREARYVSRESDLSGLFITDVKYVGTYTKNPFYSHPHRDLCLRAHRAIQPERRGS